MKTSDHDETKTKLKYPPISSRSELLTYIYVNTKGKIWFC